jgi:hypothetical protein
MNGSTVAEGPRTAVFGTRNGGQHFGDSGCLIGMKRKKVEFRNKMARAVRLPVQRPVPEEKDLYDLSTPLWHKYYEAVRKGIRFPRYYKHELNW